MIEIKVNQKELSDITKQLKDFPKELIRAIRNAINATATAVRTLAFKEATKVFNIKQSRLKKDSRGRDTTFIKRAMPGREYAELTFRGGEKPKDQDRPGLQHFRIGSQVNKKKSNPRVQIRRGGIVKEIKGGFYGEGGLKGQGIFQRQKGTKKIIRRTGPGIKMMVEYPDVKKNYEAEGKKILFEKLKEKVDDQLKKI